MGRQGIHKNLPIDESISSDAKSMNSALFTQPFAKIDREEFQRLSEILGCFTDDPYVFKLILLITLLDSSKNKKISDLQLMYLHLMVKKIAKSLKCKIQDEAAFELVKRDILKCYSRFVENVTAMGGIMKKYMLIRPQNALPPPSK